MRTPFDAQVGVSHHEPAKAVRQRVSRLQTCSY